MADIDVYKVNNVYVKIDCARSIASELSEYLSFYVTGYKYMRKYKEKLWDGKIRLFNLNTMQIYYGLIHKVEEFSKMNGYSINIECVKNKSHITETQLKTFIGGLNLHSDGNPITPYDYQQLAVYSMIENKRVTLVSPTASGKSIIIHMMAQYMLTMNKTVLIIVPTVGLVSQMYNDFLDYSTHHAFSVEDNVHCIKGGAEKTTNKPIVISTWQSIYKGSRKFFNTELFEGVSVGCVMVDECHNVKAASLTSVLEKLVNTEYRYGLTGTLDDTLSNVLTIEGLLGKSNKVITTKELMDRKSIATLNIKAIMLQYTDKEKQLVTGSKYPDEVNWIVNHPGRINFVSMLAVAQSKNCLILYRYREHGRNIETTINDIIKDNPDRKVYAINGSTPPDERESIRQQMEKEDNAILIGSLGCISTGISIKNLHSIIFAAAVKSKISTLQSIGRGLRISKNKSNVVLFDIVDDLSWKSKQNYALEHFLERTIYYDKEKFEYAQTRVKGF
ncbi:MAG: DEAD/DEAH box helicase family protein [Ghiorsea sp.]